MKLTNHSKQLMSLFKNNVNYTNHNNNTDRIILKLYDDMMEAFASLNKSKPLYKAAVKNITNTSHITRPKTFKTSDIPPEVVKHIDEFSSSEITYSFVYLGRKTQIHFVTQDKINDINLKMYNRYVDAIIMWLFMLNKYASKQCSQTLVLFIYMTSLDKILPDSNSHVLNSGNVNTAFTWACPVNSEIVIFRKEEWFKVLIHESIHSFGLDFATMDISASTKYILNIFKVSSKVNLFESYTEAWAEIMNLMFCCFFSLKDKTNEVDFLDSFELLINYERCYSFYQMVKVLHFMGLDYRDFYSSSDKARMLREMLYKEDTNVLSYYIIKCILLNNYHGFLVWCDKKNYSLLQFKQTNDNQIEFCKFIEKNYKSSSMLDGVRKASDLFYSHKKSQHKKFLLTNMRMTIAELG
jgi:hypothetical protein